MTAPKLGHESAFGYATRTRKDYQSMHNAGNGVYSDDQIPTITEVSGGASKRELAAFMICQGMWSDTKTANTLAAGATKAEMLQKIAELAVQQTDALLAELAK